MPRDRLKQRQLSDKQAERMTQLLRETAVVDEITTRQWHDRLAATIAGCVDDRRGS